MGAGRSAYCFINVHQIKDVKKKLKQYEQHIKAEE